MMAHAYPALRRGMKKGQMFKVFLWGWDYIVSSRLVREKWKKTRKLQRYYTLTLGFKIVTPLSFKNIRIRGLLGISKFSMPKSICEVKVFFGNTNRIQE